MSTINVVCKNVPNSPATVVTPESSALFEVVKGEGQKRLGALAYDCATCREAHSQPVNRFYHDILVAKGWSPIPILPSTDEEEINFAEMFKSSNARSIEKAASSTYLDPNTDPFVRERIGKGVLTVPVHIAISQQELKDQPQIGGEVA